MLVLGIDPGSKASGYGLIEDVGGRLRAVDHGVIAPPRGLPFLERLPHLASGFERLIETVRPDAAAVEDLFHARNSRVALQLGHVRGVVLLPLLRQGVPIHAYAPRLVKKAVTGYGGADKEQVQRMVGLLLGLRAGRLAVDASDALAVAICHAHSFAHQRIRQAAEA
ncbi:MAG TPA: crossover junction endodeoxyribonuclease RuvC [Candidatus Polarisedimenticolia bacterium]|nr:crossover junction endodeoxyribonuclease RuvC [Candidatus Polarisedimenticolia bacterium]